MTKKNLQVNKSESKLYLQQASSNKYLFSLKFADPITEAPSTNSNSTGGNDTDSGTADQVKPKGRLI